MNIAVFLSGTGSNFESIASAIERKELEATVTLVASNKPDAGGLDKARRMRITTAVFNRKEFVDGESFADFVQMQLDDCNVDLIVLAGYLRKIPPKVIRVYQNRIVNIHPALLPDFGGKGMYGMNVHRAVIESGVKETGVTVHYVDEKYDHGDIIAQRKIHVLPEDTPTSIAARVLEVEHQFYPIVLQRLATM